MRIGALQFDVRRGDVEHNVAAVVKGLHAARADGLDLVCLPEMWPTSFADPRDDDAWIDASRSAVERVAALGAELDLAIVGSAFGRAASGRPTNRLHVLDGGRERAAYDKLHLFSPTAEGETFAAGDVAPPVVDVRGVRLAGMICYDLRFPEVAREVFRCGAELLCVPAQWPRPREPHWRGLVVGRAVELQGHVLAANRTGNDVVGRRELELAFPGNSLVCDPHGAVLAEGRGPAGLVSADVDLERARRLRVRVPVAKDERPDLYRRWLAQRAHRREPGSPSR